jgi:hypothetical protein
MPAAKGMIRSAQRRPSTLNAGTVAAAPSSGAFGDVTARVSKPEQFTAGFSPKPSTHRNKLNAAAFSSFVERKRGEHDRWNP